jgi:hypothetical protein
VAQHADWTSFSPNIKFLRTVFRLSADESAGTRRRPHMCSELNMVPILSLLEKQFMNDSSGTMEIEASWKAKLRISVAVAIGRNPKLQFLPDYENI